MRAILRFPGRFLCIQPEKKILHFRLKFLVKIYFAQIFFFFLIFFYSTFSGSEHSPLTISVHPESKLRIIAPMQAIPPETKRKQRVPRLPKRESIMKGDRNLATASNIPQRALFMKIFPERLPAFKPNLKFFRKKLSLFGFFF